MYILTVSILEQQKSRIDIVRGIRVRMYCHQDLNRDGRVLLVETGNGIWASVY